jgi:hypothetical protein
LIEFGIDTEVCGLNELWSHGACSCDHYKNQLKGALSFLLPVEHRRYRTCNRLAIVKPLKRNKVSLELRRSARQNDER